MESTEMDEAYLSELCVLCVEDEQLVLDQEARFIGRRCREVLLARDGREGLEAYRTHRPDLVVTDLHLPGMDGLKLAAALREHDPGLPIIAVTALERPDILEAAKDAGIGQYLVKPVLLNLLHRALVDAAGHLRRAREASTG